MFVASEGQQLVRESKEAERETDASVKVIEEIIQEAIVSRKSTALRAHEGLKNPRVIKRC